MNPVDHATHNQRQAADPLRSVFVTANAGSGKTKVLVDRIARLLLEGSKPSSFLCITYTKAAAAEMQRRLFERLGQWCVASDEELAAELMKLEGVDTPPSPERLAKARALFASALETPGGLKIQTIHAFCERLLARFPLEAGVAPGFDIADDARGDALLERARADSVLKAETDTLLAFNRFATRMAAGSLDALMDRLAGERAAFRRFGAKDAAARLRQRHKATQDAESFVQAALDNAPWDQLQAARNILCASTAADQKVGARIDLALAARNAGDPRAALHAFCGVALKKDGEAYAKPVTKKVAGDYPWIERLIADVATSACVAIEGLNAIDRAEDCAALSALAARLDDAYEHAKDRAGVLDFEDLIHHADRLLSRSDSAPWVLYKLDGGLDHILIDEGQDTSPAQWDLIAPLQDEFFSGGGARANLRTVFAVGDPKQSIYAFQGADPERFLAETRALEARAKLAEQEFSAPSLETSFRSAPEILAAVDHVLADKDLAPGAVEGSNITRHLASRASEPGLVEVWPIAMRPDKPEGEAWDAPLDNETQSSAPAVLARTIAQQARGWVKDKHGVWEKGTLRPMHGGDILVLVRKRGALFRELIRAFKREGFAVAGADRMTLRDELAVEDALALIRVALDPADDLALACVLKGPWCDLADDDADLFPLAYGRGKDETLFSRLMQSDDARYAAARLFVQHVMERADDDAFAFLSWALETRFADGQSGWVRVLSRLGAEARDPLEELLSRALRPSGHVAPSLQRFLFEIESDAGQVKREMEGAGANVRVMTVHGAKGLEAPVVILPDTTGPANDRAEDGLIFTPDGPYLLLKKELDDAVTRAAREDYARRALGEHWRLLYVAMTRARDRLIVCGHQHGGAATGEATNAWRCAIETALTPYAEKIETPFGPGLRMGRPAHATSAATHADVKVVLPAWTQNLAPQTRAIENIAPSPVKRANPAVFSPRGEGRTRFRRGRLIHGLLERLPDVPQARREEAARAWLKRQGATDAECDAMANEALGVIAEPGFAAVFGPAGRAEIPIIGEAAGRSVRGIIDRLVLDDQGVLILDFKTDRPAPLDAKDAPAPYVRQMALYSAVVAKIFPGKAVRCALLWTEAPRLMALSEAQLKAQLEALGSA